MGQVQGKNGKWDEKNPLDLDIFFRILEFCSWRDRATVFQLSWYFARLSRQDNVWGWMCSRLRIESSVYISSIIPADGWRAKFIDEAWPMRLRWMQSADGPNHHRRLPEQKLRTIVAARFRPLLSKRAQNEAAKRAKLAIDAAEMKKKKKEEEEEAEEEAEEEVCYDDWSWTDDFGDGCDWYYHNIVACGAFGGSALDACCACGGGYNGVLYDQAT